MAKTGDQASWQARYPMSVDEGLGKKHRKSKRRTWMKGARVRFVGVGVDKGREKRGFGS